MTFCKSNKKLLDKIINLAVFNILPFFNIFDIF